MTKDTTLRKKLTAVLDVFMNMNQIHHFNFVI